ncbi:hypothetical protein ACFL35_02460 [Candidatus Riflebacteria bacterium]
MNIKVTGKTIKQSISWLLIFLLLFSPLQVYSNEQLSPQTEEMQKDDAKEVVGTIIKYDSKLRMGKVLWQAFKDSKQTGEKRDWAKFKQLVKERTGKPMMYHFGVDMTMTATGTLLQFAMMGLGPLGIAAGTLLNNTISPLGGALGYEISESMTRKEKIGTKMLIGRSFQNIDAASFAGRTIGGITGALVGTMLTPFAPFLGVAVGGMLGSFAGGMLTNLFRKGEFGKKVCDKIQQGWNWLGSKIMGKKKDEVVNSQLPELDINPDSVPNTQAGTVAASSAENNNYFEPEADPTVFSVDTLRDAYNNYIIEYQKYKKVLLEKGNAAAKATWLKVQEARQKYLKLRRSPTPGALR